MLENLSAGDRQLLNPGGIDFDEENGYLIVKIDPQDYGYPQTRVKYKDTTLQPKDELHITVISQESAEKLAGFMKENSGNRDKVRNLVYETDWSFRKQDRFFWIQGEEGLETIIQMVEAPVMIDFFRELSQITGFGLEPPPAHVTLFMHGTDKGIGLPDRDAFERITKEKIDLNDLEVVQAD